MTRLDLAAMKRRAGLAREEMLCVGGGRVAADVLVNDLPRLIQWAEEHIQRDRQRLADLATAALATAEEIREETAAG